MEKKDFIKSGIYGVIVGDCLGMPYEFSTPQEMKENICTGMIGYGTYPYPKGTWTDDSSMTLATINSLIKNNGEVNYDSLMREFSRWLFGAEYTVDGITFDYGNATYQGINNYVCGIDALDCGLKGEYDNGNGSLMRILPLAFTDADYETIMNVSGLTHAHDRSKIACVLYVEIARQIMKHYGGEYTFCDCVSEASDLIKDYFDGNKELGYFNRIFESDYSGGISGGRHVVTTLESAIASIKYNDDFESALLCCVNLGGDTDTVSAVCGGLAGLYYGVENIPVEWLESIRRLDYVDELVDGLVGVVG